VKRSRSLPNGPLPEAHSLIARLPLALLGLSALVAVLEAALPASVAAQTALFNAVEVEQDKFVIVAAPIGDGSRAQLNIYEQVTNRRPCFATSGAAPTLVEPLLGSFDFTGICSRYMDANGYSVRVGTQDLATVYRLSVVRSGNDTVLLAAPTRGQAGPEMIVARTNGTAGGFLKLQPEPGWRLMRRHFGQRRLGHLYLYRDSWPGEASAQRVVDPAPGQFAPAVAPPAPGSPAGTGAPAAPGPQSAPGAPQRIPVSTSPGT
jgi:hypothetical protein